MLHCRGIRGATTAEANTAAAILSATRELLTLMVESNEVQVEDITSAFFTLTDDLNAVHLRPTRAFVSVAATPAQPAAQGGDR
jgi:chorismate mutase